MNISTFFIPISISIILLLGYLFGMIDVDLMDTYQDTSTHTKDTEQWLKRFASHESINRSTNDILPLQGTLLISPDYSWHIRKKYMSHIEKQLDIRMYNITDNESRVLLKDLARQGVKVRMILEDDKFGSDENMEQRGRGIQVRNDEKLHTNFVHAKTFVSSGLYIIQTANLTHSARNTQREHYIIGNDKTVIQSLQLIFNKDWEGKRIEPNDIHPNLLVCGIDCRYKLSQLIQSARHSIIIQNQYIEDEEIIGLLHKKVAQGLDVYINLPEDEKEKTEQLPFVQSIRFLKNPRIHSKTMLIDDHYLLVSSINLSTNSLDNNREIGIIITDQQAILEYKKQFMSDRNDSITIGK